MTRGFWLNAGALVFSFTVMIWAADREKWERENIGPREHPLSFGRALFAVVWILTACASALVCAVQLVRAVWGE